MDVYNKDIFQNSGMLKIPYLDMGHLIFNRAEFFFKTTVT